MCMHVTTRVPSALGGEEEEGLGLPELLSEDELPQKPCAPQSPGAEF